MNADINPEQVKRLQRDSQTEHEVSVFVVPRRTLVFNKIFEDAGILGDLVVEELPWYFLPLENDVLSLELNDSFGDLFLVSTSLAILPPACLHSVAQRSYKRLHCG